jgi:hypothetical protein
MAPSWHHYGTNTSHNGATWWRTGATSPASDEARFVTWTEIVVDGGITARCD